MNEPKLNPKDTRSSGPRFDPEAEVRTLNDLALEEVKAKYRILLRYGKGIHWRVTSRSTGHIPGVPFPLIILCTDGCIGWFEKFDGTTFHGHIKHFSGEVKPMYSVKKPGEPTPDIRPERKRRPAHKKKPSSIQQALDEIEQALRELE